MPIEVRELIIKTRVEEVSSGSGGGNANNGNAHSKSLTERDMHKIVAMCAEEVMKALKRQKER